MSRNRILMRNESNKGTQIFKIAITVGMPLLSTLKLLSTHFTKIRASVLLFIILVKYCITLNPYIMEQ